MFINLQMFLLLYNFLIALSVDIHIHYSLYTIYIYIYDDSWYIFFKLLIESFRNPSRNKFLNFRYVMYQDMFLNIDVID